jgi:hypothetical protein
MSHRSRTLPRLLATLLAPLAAASCSGGAASDDASVVDAREQTLAAPSPPAAPALPDLTPCPPGWREIAVGAATACEPFGDDAPVRCGPDEIHVHGRAAGEACEAAQPCPAGEWPDDAAADAVYARAGAVDGDGTRARPFGTLAAALAAASSTGRPVVLGEGVLEGGVRVQGVPSISGLCPERTRIVDTATTNSAALIARPGVPLSLRGVHLDGALYGLWVARGASVSGEGIVANGTSTAVRLDGGSSAELHRLRAETPVSSDFVHAALRVGPGATLRVREATLLGGGSLVYAYGEDPATDVATVTVEDATLLDSPVGVAGYLDVTLRRAAIENVDFGVLTISPRRAVLEDVRARGVAPDTSDSVFLYASGGTLSLTRVSLLGLGRAGAMLARNVEGSFAADAHIEATDVIVDGVGGEVAIQIEAATSLDLTRALVSRTAGTAIVATSGGQLALRDVTIRETTASADQSLGHGVAVGGPGSSAIIERLVAAPALGGILAHDEGRVMASDVEIEGGLGVAAQCEQGSACPSGEAMLVLERARIRGATRYGVASVASHVRLVDVDVDGVVVPESSTIPGLGVLAYAGELEGERLRVRGVAGIGVISLGSVVTLSDVEVVDTAPRDCEGCASGTLGDGLTCATDAELGVTRLLVHGSRRAGVTAARGCRSVSFASGVVERNGIGVLTDESVDATLFRTLLVRDNGTDYDRVSLTLAPEELGLE